MHILMRHVLLKEDWVAQKEKEPTTLDKIERELPGLI
jgi:hypothetical protein